MSYLRALAAFSAVSVLVGCGGNDGPSTTQPPPRSDGTSFSATNSTFLPKAGGSDWIDASNEPLLTDDTGVIGYVGGVDLQKMLIQTEHVFKAASTAHRPNHGNTQTWRFRVRDGTSAARLRAYLDADMADNGGNLVLWDRPPVVRVVHGTSEDQEFDVRTAVRLLNSALPADWQIRFGDSRSSHTHRDGEIIVEFSRASTWPEGHRHSIGLATYRATQVGHNLEAVDSALVWVDDSRLHHSRDIANVLLHELLHALGRGHVPEIRFPDSLMKPYGLDSAEFLVFWQLDQDVLYLLHEDDDWGPWTDVSSHVVGRIGFVPGQQRSVVYGAVARNGLVRPWAIASYPSEPMTQGFGSASWRGKMLGLTPREEAVAGDVDMRVRFSSLTGNIDFTNIEKWDRFAAPGQVGTGTMWGDGDLNYTIEVVGQGFQQTGGDAGKVTGVFYKDNHQQAGGTLRRNDLAAGFGAERQ